MCIHDAFRWPSVCCVLVLALALTACTHAVTPTHSELRPHSNPNLLWHLVHDGCVPAARLGRYPPKPCTEVSAPPGHSDRGYAVLKDIRGRYQYLVLPIARITGIESQALLQPDAPNYLADAWSARLYVEAALHKDLPRYMLSLAVNSKYGRSQNQLHIHVDCIRVDVHKTLRRLLPGISVQWKTLPEPLQGHVYLARWVAGATLSIKPFRSLAVALPDGAGMAEYGFAVVGALSTAGDPGFILLATRADIGTGNYASSEELQDHSCAIVHPATP
ncbi:MAG: CDP-diacylglycerol diphosphatase [Sinobacteraceae bacterium]|nr:CDP-diacylglycerol diphosphatase [Nevskiaceae bacterium]